MIKLKSLIKEMYVPGFVSDKTAKKFRVPENLDCFKEGNGWSVHHGCNDWEQGTTGACAYIGPEGYNREQIRVWFEIQYPEKLSELVNSGVSRDKYKLEMEEIQNWGRKAVSTWVRETKRIHRAFNPRPFPVGSGFMRKRWKECFIEALQSEVMKPYIKNYGVDHSNWVGMKRENIKENIIKEGFQTGEWWIYPGGSAQFADIDIGESGHEGYVIQHVTGEILGHFGLSADEPSILSEYEDEIKNVLVESDNLSPEELTEWEEDGPEGIISEKLAKMGAYKDINSASDAVSVSYGRGYGTSKHRDARDYGMEVLRWKRVYSRPNEALVQIWYLTSEDLKDISRGLSDIWDENGESEEGNTVDIEVRSNNYIFKEIPLEVLESPNAINKIGKYRVRSMWMTEGIKKGKGWFVYEGTGYVTAVLENGNQISFELNYGNKTGLEKENVSKKAASKWAKLAREIYNNPEINEIGNPQQKTWEKCFQEALDNPEMREYIKNKKLNAVFDPVNFTKSV